MLGESAEKLKKRYFSFFVDNNKKDKTNNKKRQDSKSGDDTKMKFFLSIDSMKKFQVKYFSKSITLSLVNVFKLII